MLSHICIHAKKYYQCDFKFEIRSNINRLRQFNKVTHKKPTSLRKEVHMSPSDYSDHHISLNTALHLREHSFDTPDSKPSTKRVPNATFQALWIYRSTASGIPISRKARRALKPMSVISSNKSRDSSAAKTQTYSQSDLSVIGHPRHLSTIPVDRDDSLIRNTSTIDAKPNANISHIRKSIPLNIKVPRSSSTNSDVIIEEQLNESTESLKKITRIRSKNFKSTIDSRSQSRNKEKVNVEINHATIDLSNVSKNLHSPKPKKKPEEIIRNMCKIFHKFEDRHNEIINRSRASKSKVYNSITIYTQNAINNSIQIYSDSDQSSKNSKKSINIDKDTVIQDLSSKLKKLQSQNKSLAAEVKRLNILLAK